MDVNGVFSAAYDPAGANLATTTVIGTAQLPLADLDVNGIFDRVFDPVTRTIRIVYV